jgi:hypothetical protein
MMDRQPERASLEHTPLPDAFLPRPSNLTHLDAHSWDEVCQPEAALLPAPTLALEPAAGPACHSRATSGFDSKNDSDADAAPLHW